jgi:hypothetical protein
VNENPGQEVTRVVYDKRIAEMRKRKAFVPVGRDEALYEAPPNIIDRSAAANFDKTKQRDARVEHVSKKLKRSEKSAKGKTDLVDDDDDDGDDEKPISKKITVHVVIENPAKAPAPSRPRQKTATMAPINTIQRGPFFHDVTHDFATLQQSIAKVTPCAVKSLVTSKMQWRFETPLNGVRKLLANDAGYNAMIAAAKSKRGDVVVFIYMPAPGKEDVVCYFDLPIINVIDQRGNRHGRPARMTRSWIR